MEGNLKAIQLRGKKQDNKPPLRGRTDAEGPPGGRRVIYISGLSSMQVPRGLSVHDQATFGTSRGVDHEYDC